MRIFAVLLGGAVLAACGGSDTRPVDSPRAEVGVEETPRAEVTASEAPRAETARRSERASRAEGRAAESAVAGEETTVAEVPVEVAEAFDRAVAAMQRGDSLEAELELEQLVFTHPEYPGPWVNLAILYRRGGRADEAADALTTALGIAPDHAVANNELGVLLREQGDFAAAEAAYRRAIESEPGYALARYNLAVLLDLYLNREEEALRLYTSYQQLLPQPDAEVGRWIVDLSRRLGIPEETVQLAQDDGR